MTDPQVAILMLGLFIFLIMLGFPIAFTLMGMAVGFGYYAYFDSRRMWRAYDRAVEEGAGFFDQAEAYIGALLNNRVFDLFVNQTYSVMANDVLTAIQLFLFLLRLLLEHVAFYIGTLAAHLDVHRPRAALRARQPQFRLRFTLQCDSARGTGCTR